MTVSKITSPRGDVSWYSSLDGGRYDSEEAAKHYETLARMRSTPESEGSKLLATLSAEQIRSLHDEMRIIADQPVALMQWQQVCQEFVDTHPDYLAVPENAHALGVLLNERNKLLPNGVFTGTMQDVEAAFYDLAERGILTCKPGIPLPKRVTETEMYEMDIDSLLKRARGW